MENATKALLIAGAVLIAIVLISVGVSILSSTNGVRNQSQNTADVMERETFNSQFLSYTGSSMSGSQVKSLLSKVIANNSTNSKEIEISYDVGDKLSGTSASDISSISSKISSITRYKVEVSYSDGYINIISITTSSK